MAIAFYLYVTLVLYLDIGSTNHRPRSTVSLSGVEPAASLLHSVSKASFLPRPFPAPRRRFSVFALLLIAGIERNPGPPSIQYGLLNTRSAVNKAPVIHDLLLTNNLDFSFFTETWFKCSDPPAVVQDIAPKGFLTIHSFRDGRKKSRGGGISLVYRNRLNFRRFHLPFKPTSFECLPTFANFNNRQINFICIYRPPPTPTSIFFDELALLADALDLLPGDNCLLGDFNCPGDTAGLDSRLAVFLNDRNLCQLVNGPTRLNNLLDLIVQSVSSDVNLGGSPRLIDVLFSDHRLVINSLVSP